MKIALVGSAPSSVRLAPFRDPSWTVWACSPGTYPIVEMEGAAAFFELHRWEPPVIGRPDQQVPWFSPEYCAWLAKFKGPVYTTEVIPDIKNSTRLPREMLIEKYGPYFWSSSLAWMLALALEQPGIQEIGLWGVDMSAVEEYRYHARAVTTSSRSRWNVASRSRSRRSPTCSSRCRSTGWTSGTRSRSSSSPDSANSPHGCSRAVQREAQAPRGGSLPPRRDGRPEVHAGHLDEHARARPNPRTHGERRARAGAGRADPRGSR
jgi:hypothetical protein